MAQLSAADRTQVEREFPAQKAAVLAMLREEFPRLQDPEDLFQEACALACERLANGETIRNPRALLKTIAWCRANNQVTRTRTTPTDPTSAVIVGHPDFEPAIDEQVASRLDSAEMRHIVEDLAPKQAAVIKLRFDEDRSAREIQQRLGITAKRMEKLVKAAYERVQANLEPDGGAESRWRRRQRSLLLACETGLASPRQRARAQRMVDEDPVCRAMLREMRATLRELGALVPVPIIVESNHDRLARVPATVWDRIAVAREHVSDLVTRSTPHAQTIEQAGAGLAGALGAGVAAKAVIVCTLAAGGAVVCIETGLRSGDPPSRPSESQAQPRRTAPPREPRPPIIATPAPTKRSTTPKRRAVTNRSTSSGGGSRSASAPPAPSPVEQGSTEFGPGAIGSSSAPTQPAAAPTGGGGEFLP